MEGSTKLKLAYIDRMYRANLTSAEVDFILWLALKQDNSGRVRGIHYKDACEELNLSIQKYYDICNSLQAKGLIQWTKQSYWDRDFVLTDNSFVRGKADFKQGFVNVSYEFFRSDDFRKMKAGSKLLAIDCYRISRTNNVSYQIYVKNFFEKYSALFGVTVKVLREYLKEIKKFFSVGIKNGKYYITPLAATKMSVIDETEKSLCYQQIVRAACRRIRINIKDVPGWVLKNIYALFDQYKNYGGNSLADLMITSILESIRNANSECKRKKDWIRELDIKFIHKILNSKLHQLKLI